MVCIYCREKTKTGNSRPTHRGHQVWRRKNCPNCQAVFTTRETVDLSAAVRVATAENAIQPFLRDKLMISLYSSLSHRQTALYDAGELCETVVDKLIEQIEGGIITSAAISEIVHRVLAQFDKAGDVYYLAHHTLEGRS